MVCSSSTRDCSLDAILQLLDLRQKTDSPQKVVAKCMRGNQCAPYNYKLLCNAKLFILASSLWANGD